MSYQPSDFVGTYNMQQGTVSGPFSPAGEQRIVEVGNTVYVGAGPATPPFSKDGQDYVGVVVMSGGQQVYPKSGSVVCQFDAGNRFFRGFADAIVIQISLYWDQHASYKTVYGLLTYGDPENVGVWGATDEGG